MAGELTEKERFEGKRVTGEDYVTINGRFLAGKIIKKIPKS